MTRKPSRKGLQVFTALLGSVAVVAGLSTVLLGADSIAGAESVSPSVDSEMRFYAVWYFGAGLALLRSVPRVESDSTIIRAVAALFFLAGCSRALSWMVLGKPHTVAVVLMVIELVLPLMIVPWQAAVARARTANN